jgi:hypothetical protein
MLIAIDSRRHIPKDATRTRLGIGDQFIDHAAGKPLSARQSFAGIPAPADDAGHSVAGRATSRHYVIAPVHPGSSSEDWADAPSLHDRQKLSEVLHANEAPVDLPLRSRARTYLVIAGIVVAFIAMLAGTFFAGATSQVKEPVEDPAVPAEPSPGPQTP